jgi:dipeptidyl aminopeptidase/acylaminoacyl peptidase
MNTHCLASLLPGPLVLLHRLALTLLLVGAVTAGKAQTQAAAPPVPAELFFKHPDVLQAVLSPSGNQLAITTSKGAQRVGLLVVALEAGNKMRRVAQFSDADVINFQWVGDDWLVFGVADLATGSGEDRRAGRGLYSVKSDGSYIRLLVERQNKPFVTNGSTTTTEALTWNHRLLHVPAPVPGSPNEEIVIGTLNFGGGNELLAVTPLWQNVRTGRTRFMPLDAPKGSVRWMFDGQGQARVAMTHRDGKAGIHWRAPGQVDWQMLEEADLVRDRITPEFVDDSGTLYVSHAQGQEGFRVLSRFDFKQRAPASQPWVVTPGFDFSGTIIREHGGSPALGVRVETDAESTVWLDPKMKAFQALADDRLPGLVTRVSCRRCGQTDMVALVRAWSDRDPGQLWVYTAANTRWQRVATVHDGIDPSAMATVDFQRIKARDGRDLPVWLTLPPGHQPGKASPAVVLVHGGPWVRGGHWRWSATEQFLASRGYVVISPDFRGSEGYGRAHLEAGFKQWGRAMQDDVADALLWAQNQGIANKRACIAGASYGGYATLMGLVRHPELYRCGIAWVAVTDPFLYLEGSFWVRDDISDSGRRYSLPQMVGDAKADADMLTAVSPVAQAERIRAPLLLAFGESDLRVPLAHGKRLREAMRSAGNEPEWVTYPNEAHGWRKPENSVDWAKRMEKFLAQHLLAK